MELTITNIPKSARVDLEKWAKYTVDKFEFAVSKFKLKDSGKLINSFQYQVSQDADGSTAMISFAFEYYLRMIDMGVGSGTTYDDRDDQYAKNRAFGRGAGTRRRKYPVYNKIFYSQLMRLNELLQKYYNNTALNVITNGTS